MLANLNFIVLLAAVIGVMWLLLFLKDLFAAKCARRLKLKERIWYDDFEAKWHNLAQRFTYEIFLELVICSLISLAPRDSYTSDNFTKEEAHETKLGLVNQLPAMLVLTICLALTFYTAGFLWKICHNKKPKLLRVSNVFHELPDLCLRCLKRENIEKKELQR